MMTLHLTSLRNTMILMVSFGLLMGLVFPFYSAMFFGERAFNPLYVCGCLIAGLLVGVFCSYIVKKVLKLQFKRQLDSLFTISSSEELCKLERHTDELEQLQACHDALINRLSFMAGNVFKISEELTSKFQNLGKTSREMMDGNDQQWVKEQESLDAVALMTDFFSSLLAEIKDMAERSEQQAAIAVQMNATTDAISLTIQNYSKAVTNTSASIDKMALSIKEISNNVDSLSTSAEQTLTSIQQISTATGNVRDNTQKAVESSENVRKLAQDGMRAMTATLKAMHEIEQSNEESYEAISRLSVHSARVGEFVKMIQEVVEQTTLLSLNASIIAAQAGDRGKAFAVVAEEVRSLAHRTSSSATEIQDLVRNIQKETAAVQLAIAKGKDRGKGGVKISAIASNALNKIEGTSTQVANMIQEIAATTVSQAADSRVINDEAAKNLDTIRQITHSIKEQERDTLTVVKTLEEMMVFSRKISSSTSEQSYGTQLYLQNVIQNEEKIKQIRDTSIEQLGLAEELNRCLSESGLLMQSNAANARQMMSQIENLAQDTQLLHQQMVLFRGH